jgi:DNA-directed RNA polymerase II subunit RPB1
MSKNYDHSISNIKQIEFSVFGNTEILLNSATEQDPNGITLPDSYENSEPRRSGLVDPRLGISERHLDCATCGQNTIDCPGHFGHMKLEEPVYNIIYLPIVKKILSCIDLRTSRLLIDKKNKELMRKIYQKKGKHRFNLVKKESQKITTVNSKSKQPVPKIKDDRSRTGTVSLVAEITLDNIESESGETKKKIREVITPKIAYDILRNISNEDIIILGMNPNYHKPCDLVMTMFPFPPVIIRPSVRQNILASNTYENILTHKLSDIVKANERIRKQKDKDRIKGEQSKWINENRELLQYQVATFQDNGSNALPPSEIKAGGKTTKSVTERLKSKTGRIRGNLMGKRVDYSGRTVITGDPNLRQDELRVPKKIAMNLTIPEVVIPENIDKLQNLVNNGRAKWPGANFVHPIKYINKKKTSRIDLRYNNHYKLQLGDVVDRHLHNGDPILFNRQPSLHKQSMMCHKARIFDTDTINTFGFSVMNTPPYNADFDGDEMNIHIPQTYSTMTELQMIANVQNHIIGSRDGNVIIEPVQDIRLGTYLLSKDKKLYSWNEFMNINTYFELEDDINISKKKKYTFSEIYSRILDSKLTLKVADLEIRKGKLVSGVIDKRMNRTIIAKIWNKFNPSITSNYLFNIQRLAILYLYNRGFSVGLGDCILPKKATNEVELFIEKRKTEAMNLITQVENNPEIMDHTILEETLKGLFNLKAKDEVVKIMMKYLDDKNNFYVLVNSGAKGGKTNLHEIMASVCQSIFLSNRIQKKVYNRSTVHFHQDDDSGKARGFIENSLLKGLTAEEFFFYHMAGREGLIDTAIKTSDSGYIQRKMVKGCEDIYVSHDGTVRTATNQLIQLIYGDCNYNHVKLVKHKIPSFEEKNSDLLKSWNIKDKDLKSLLKQTGESFASTNKLLKSYNATLIECLNVLRESSILVELNYRAAPNSFKLPFDIKRLILEAKTDHNLNNSKLTPKYIIDEILNSLKLDRTKLIFKRKSDKNKIKDNDNYTNKLVLKTILMDYLHPKKMIFNEKLSKEGFNYIIKEIINSYNDSMVPPGEMVGALTALHIGEPTTQLTLNTFHATGSGNSGIQGVPRFKELIDINKNVKTPIMDIYALNTINSNELKMLNLRSAMKYTSLYDITKSVQLIYDPLTTNPDSKHILDNVSNPLFVSMKQKTDLNKLPLLYRFILDKESLLDKSINMLELKILFIKFWKNKVMDMKGLKRQEKDILNQVLNICILTNKDGDNNPVIHIRMNLLQYSIEKFDRIKFLIMNEFVIKGFSLIKDIDDLIDIASINLNEDGFYKMKEFIFQTDGIDLYNIRYLRGVDLKRSSCNSVYKIYKTFGIEAARMCLLKEMRIVFNTEINYPHYSILTDNMCYTGHLVSMNRHGINKLETDPLGRASFENTIDQLRDAAIFNEVDYMRGVSSRIMAGQSIYGGTGICKLKMDTNMLENAELTDIKDVYDKKIEINFNNILSDITNNYFSELYISN